MRTKFADLSDDLVQRRGSRVIARWPAGLVGEGTAGSSDRVRGADGRHRWIKLFDLLPQWLTALRRAERDGDRLQARRVDSKLSSAGGTRKEAIAGVDDVANVDDPMKAWQDMIEQFQKAGFGWKAPDFLQTMFAPMQQQLDLLQEAFETQAELNRKLTQQALAPMRQVLEGMQQAAKTTRAAGEALKEAGDLLMQQAAAMDQALSFTGPFFEMTAAPTEGTTKTE